MKVLFLLAAAFFIVTSVGAQNYTIQQYLTIKSANSPTFSPDGTHLAYLTNVTGTAQVWAIDLPNGKPRQLTNYDDNVGFVQWLHDGSGFIFGKAKGGDENTQFYWMKPDGSGVRALTDEPAIRHNFGLVSSDGSTIFYSSNKRNRQYFDIYSLNINTGKETLLYQNDGNNSVLDVDIGGRLLVSRDAEELSLDNNIYLVDPRANSEILLTPHTGAAEFGNAHFVADGIVFAQNSEREFISLSQLRKKNAARDDWSDSNREVRVIDNSDWDVSDIAMETYPSAIAYTKDRDGFSELYLRKIETGGKPLITNIAQSAEAVRLPAQGIVGGLAFSKDQTKLAFSFSSATQNGDVWVYDVGTKRLSQVTHSDRAGIDASSFVTPKLIKFKTFDGREIPAWYYQPKMTPTAELPAPKYEVPANPGMVATEPLAMNRRDNQPPLSSAEKVTPAATSAKGRVIVSVHGGPEGQERPGFSGLYQYYLSRGYAILAPNVRGSTGYGKSYTHLDDVKNREDSVKDLAYAVEWLKTEGNADPHRIAVMGGSYGGYMTLAAITLYPDLWAAAVDTVGIANWESFLKNTSGYRRRQREVEYGRLDRDIDFLRSISPIAKVNRITAPLFVIAGKNDPRVPYTEAEQMVAAIRKQGGTVQYKLYDDEGHGVSKLKNRLELYPLVADFLDKYMR